MSANHPPSQRSTGVSDPRKIIVVVPPEGFGLLKEIDSFEVSGELNNEGGVELSIEGVSGEAVLQVVEHVGDTVVELK